MHLIAKRTPALEWAFWKSGMKSVVPIDMTSLDHEKLHALSHHTDLLQQLDRWILHPDRVLLPSLRKLAEIVNQLYHFEQLVLYRGVNPWIKYQDTMGLTGHYEAGEGHSYTLENPLSFTTDEAIGREFGKVLVKTDLHPLSTPALVITDELATLVCQLRNIAPETQKEVIVFPPAVIQFTILEK